MENIKNLKLYSKWRIFRFQDGTLLDVTKIDFIINHPKDDDKYIVQVNGKQTTLDKDQDAENLIKTWDMYLRNEEKNVEYTYLYEKEMLAIFSILNRKLDIALAAYTKVHKDEVPEYPLGDVKSDWSPNFKRG